MALIWVQVIVIYNSDDGNQYILGLSNANQAAGGFSLADAGQEIDYPKPWRTRHVLGINSAGSGGSGISPRHKLPCASQSTSVFQTGGSFTISYNGGAVSFDVQGRVGEKRKAKV